MMEIFKMKSKIINRMMAKRIKYLVILCVYCLTLTPSAFAGTGDDFKVTLLGTGSPTTSIERFGPSTLVEAGNQRLLFDMGRGATIRLQQNKIPIGSINAHFLTHLHSDHINGLSDVWLTGWLNPPTLGGRTKHFKIFGPSGTEEMMSHLWEAYSEDRRIRIEDEHLPIEGIKIDAKNFQPGVVYEKDGVTVTAFEVNHGEHVKPAFGFKVTYNGHSVVISGDTKYHKNVEKAATGADLLIHEVAMAPESLLKTRAGVKTVFEHHISPEKAGQLFATARPKMVAYTHIVFLIPPGSAIKPITTEDLVTATRKTYDGPLVVGKDLMTFLIDDSGVKIIK